MLSSVTRSWFSIDHKFIGFDGTHPKGMDILVLSILKSLGKVEHVITEYNDYEVLLIRGNRIVLSISPILKTTLSECKKINNRL
jgi:hypothetical protein